MKDPSTVGASSDTFLAFKRSSKSKLYGSRFPGPGKPSNRASWRIVERRIYRDLTVLIDGRRSNL